MGRETHKSDERTSGLKDHIAKAEANELPADELQSILAEARSTGDSEQLRKALEYLVFEYGNDSTYGIRYGAFLDAIKGLLANDKVDAVNHVKLALWRAEKERRRQDTQDILPKRSANCRRRKKGQAEHGVLNRQPAPVEDDGYINDEFDLMPVSEPAGTDSLEEMKLDLAKTEFEVDVMELLSQGYTQLQVAATLGTTKYAVVEAIKLIAARAERAGYE